MNIGVAIVLALALAIVGWFLWDLCAYLWAHLKLRVIRWYVRRVARQHNISLDDDDDGPDRAKIDP